MIHPEDTKTIPLPLQPITEKRSRGRPRKEGGALTNAQRQAAYRERRKASGNPVTVTKNIPLAADAYDELVMENERLREEIAEMRHEAEGLRGSLAAAERVGDGWCAESEQLRAELARVRRDLEMSKCKAADVRRSHTSVVHEVDWVRRVVRLPLYESKDYDRRRFSFTFDERAHAALDRLAVDAGISKADVVERLAFWADELVLESFRYDDEAFSRYLYRGRNEKSGV
ncbi:hypothetical protein [Burkholderia pseudomallei]|uniref:hypothetical protein n=1 Tax=Burkholderia pseudomallei TaxID=28450 RepID=UPI000A1A1C62|nr:hypothetical protein [Burkholderia pseudomallei]ARL97039.1 hypothetical protein BOC58_30380 [Burkholderia pseudomallei]